MKKLLIGLLAMVSISAFAGTTPKETAQKLAESNISCQQYKTKLEQLLSEDPMNFQAIKIIRDLYKSCVNNVEHAIKNGPTGIPSLAEDLYSKRLICDVETRKIEDLLSVGSRDLDFVAINSAKKKLDSCKTEARYILSFLAR